MIDAEAWVKAWVRAVNAGFGPRVRFLGLQGSYARGEADDASDIDPVMVLDEWTHGDAVRYRQLLAALPGTVVCCGFACGARELAAWDRADLFQLTRDTTALQGSLADIVPPTGDRDARRAAHRGACDLYHGLTHHAVHGASAKHVPSALKGAMFVLQARLFVQTGLYIRRHELVAAAATGEDHWVAETARDWKHREMPWEVEREVVPRLLQWLSGVIVEMGSAEG